MGVDELVSSWTGLSLFGSSGATEVSLGAISGVCVLEDGPGVIWDCCESRGTVQAAEVGF